METVTTTILETHQGLGVDLSAIPIAILTIHVALSAPFLYWLWSMYEKFKRFEVDEEGVDFFSNLKRILTSDVLKQLKSYAIMSVLILFVSVLSLLISKLEFMLLLFIIQIIIIIIVMVYNLNEYIALERAISEKTLAKFLKKLGIEPATPTYIIVCAVELFLKGWEDRVKENMDVTEENLSKAYKGLAEEISYHIRKEKRIFG